LGGRGCHDEFDQEVQRSEAQKRLQSMAQTIAHRQIAEAGSVKRLPLKDHHDKKIAPLLIHKLTHYPPLGD
jgi:hypothetical protein